MPKSLRVELSRRHFIAAAIPLIACRSNSPSADTHTPPCPFTSAPDAPTSPPAPAPVQLEVVKLGTLSETDRGGTAVVLLHGFGARGDDLVPLAHRIMQPRTQLFVPSAPLPQGPNGRAWWRFDPEHPLRTWAGNTPADYRPNTDVLVARAAVQALLRRIRTQYSPERLAIAGFSQGGMLALDVALAQDPPIERVASLSGLLLPESTESLKRFHGRALRPSGTYSDGTKYFTSHGYARATRFFVSHGRADTVLPFEGAEATRAQLTEAELPVTFVPFDGGHEIPPEVVSALTKFLFD